MEPLHCSLGECGKPLYGKAVVLGSVTELEIEDAGNFKLYEGSERPFALLHPNCYIEAFNEMAQSDKDFTLYVMLSEIANIRIALEM